MRPKAGARATVTQTGAPGGSSVAASSGWLLSPWVRSSPGPLRTGTCLVLEKKLIHLWVIFLSPLMYGLSYKIFFFFVIKKTKLKREKEKYENKTQQFLKKKRKKPH